MGRFCFVLLLLLLLLLCFLLDVRSPYNTPDCVNKKHLKFEQGLEFLFLYQGKRGNT